MSVVEDPDLFCPFGCDAIPAGDSRRYVVELASDDGRTRWQERAKWTSADARIDHVTLTAPTSETAPAAPSAFPGACLGGMRTRQAGDATRNRHARACVPGAAV